MPAVSPALAGVPAPAVCELLRPVLPAQQTEGDEVINLTDPFEFADVDYRIGATTQAKDRGMLVFYIDARAVMDRLDAYTAQHEGTWWTSYAPLADGKHIECQLTVQMPVGEALTAVTRCDVGEPSEGMGDTVKGAYSDALKRAAVQFGVGRYLYGLGETWVPIEPGPNGRGRLTDASRTAARKYYVDRVGGAEPAPTRDQAPVARKQPDADPPRTPPAPASPQAGPVAGEQRDRYPIGGVEDDTRLVHASTFWMEARKYAGPAVVNALCEELDLPLVKDMTLAQSKLVLNELERRASAAKGGVTVPVGAR